jgi:hypothetical protein
VFVTGGDAATETYADGVAASALDDALDNLSVTIRSATEPTERPNTDALRTGDVWIDTANGDKPYSWNGSAFIAAYTQISGGAITTGTVLANLVTIQTANSSPALTLNTNGISMVQQSYLTNLGSGLKWYTATTLKGVIYNDESEGDNTLNYFVTDSDGRHLFGAGDSDPDERFEINADFARTGSNQGLRVFGVFQARGELRIYDTDESNYANIAYADSTANRTYTIPNVAASDFVMSEGTQTIDGSKTFTGGFGIKATAGGIASIVYSGGATANRTFTIPAVSSAATFAVLEHAQTFTGANTFDGNVIVPNSTTSSHALNVTTADSRYGRLGSTNTWTSVQTFNSRIDLFANARIYEGGANFYSTLEYSGSSNTTSTLPEATGTLVTTANFNQDIAGVKRFTGTLRASAYRSSDNTAGATDNVSVLDSNANVVTLNFKNGLFVGTT